MAFNLQLPTLDRVRWRQARPTGARVPMKSLVLLATLLFSSNDLNGKTSNVVAATSPLLRGHEAPLDINNHVMRLLAGGAYEQGSKVCNNPASFLGVGNTKCLNANLRMSVFLLVVIVAVSIGVERLIHHTRAAIKCPQLRKIVNRVFEEVMIMGFLSMVIFTLNTSGAMKSLALDNLTASEKLHFYEFFHYIVFLTMIYFIAIVLLLLFIGTVVPKLIWEIQHHSDHHRESIDDGPNEDTYQSQFPSFTGSSSDRMRHSFIRGVSSLGRDIDPNSMGTNIIDDAERTTTGDYYSEMQGRECSNEIGLYRSLAMRARALSGMDLVMGSRAYRLLLQLYHRDGWCSYFNIRKQWNLWKNFEILAYNICQHRSGYIYKNPVEMERLFGVQPTLWRCFRDTTRNQEENMSDCKDDDNSMTYAEYHVLCMRNLLLHMTNIPPIAFLILIVIALVPSIFPDEDHWVFIGVGGLLLLLNIVIFFKVLKILRGIIDDRLQIISTRDIQARFTKAHLSSKKSRAQGQHDVFASDSAPEKSIAEDPSRSEEDGQNPLRARHKVAPKKFKAAALAVRAIIRMQMSSLCHRQLHYHDNRFWFNCPNFLLRLFQFATIGQAFYLVWLSLVEIPSMADSSAAHGGGSAFLALMIFYPVLALFVITPLTMPSLVLVMSLTGIFVDLNASNGYDVGNHHNVTQEEVKTHTRMIRRSFLRSHYTDSGSQAQLPPFGPATPSGLPNHIPDQQDAVAFPTKMFLRMYDSPVSSRRVDNGRGRNNPSGHSSRSLCSIGSTSGYNSRRACDLTVGGAAASAVFETTNKTNGQTPYQSASSFTSSTCSGSTKTEIGVPRPKMEWSQANVEPDTQVGNNAAVDNNEQEKDVEQVQSPASASFKTYCSKYGGYPDIGGASK